MCCMFLREEMGFDIKALFTPKNTNKYDRLIGLNQGYYIIVQLRY